MYKIRVRSVRKLAGYNEAGGRLQILPNCYEVARGEFNFRGQVEPAILVHAAEQRTGGILAIRLSEYHDLGTFPEVQGNEFIDFITSNPE